MPFSLKKKTGAPIIHSPVDSVKNEDTLLLLPIGISIVIFFFFL